MGQLVYTQLKHEKQQYGPLQSRRSAQFVHFLPVKTVHRFTFQTKTDWLRVQLSSQSGTCPNMETEDEEEEKKLIKDDKTQKDSIDRRRRGAAGEGQTERLIVSADILLLISL